MQKGKNFFFILGHPRRRIEVTSFCSICTCSILQLFEYNMYVERVEWYNSFILSCSIIHSVLMSTIYMTLCIIFWPKLGNTMDKLMNDYITKYHIIVSSRARCLPSKRDQIDKKIIWQHVVYRSNENIDYRYN